MRTNENRARYDRSPLRCPSDLTDEESALVEPIIPPAKRCGNRRWGKAHFPALHGYFDLWMPVAGDPEGFAAAWGNLLAARFHDGTRRLSDRDRSRQQSDRPEAARELTSTEY
jgi:hypothetical protein